MDTLEGSSFPNMKELRFQLDGLWRFAFAFDPQREAVVLVGGNKSGVNQRKFYRELISIADRRFSRDRPAAPRSPLGKILSINPEGCCPDRQKGDNSERCVGVVERLGSHET